MDYHAAISADTQINPKRWDAWLADVPGAAFQHHFAYGAAMVRGKAHYCQVTAGREVVAQAPVMRARIGPLRLSNVPAGLAMRADADVGSVYAALHKALAQTRLSVTLLSAPEAAFAAKPLMTGGYDAVVALPDHADALAGQFRQKWRNRLHKAQGHALDVQIEGPGSAAMMWLEGQETRQRKARRYKMLDVSLPRQLNAAPGRTKALCVAARQDGHYVAAASFILAGRTATYFSGVTMQPGRQLCAQHLVLAEAAKMLIERGISELNLGTLDTVKAPGLARFKLGMGANTVIRPHSYAFIGRP